MAEMLLLPPMHFVDAPCAVIQQLAAHEFVLYRGHLTLIKWKSDCTDNYFYSKFFGICLKGKHLQLTLC